MNKPKSNQLEKYELIAGLLAGNRPLISFEKALWYTTSKFSNLIKNMRRLEMDKSREKKRCQINSAILHEEFSSELLQYIYLIKKNYKKASSAALPSSLQKVNRSSILKLDEKRLLELGWIIYEMCKSDPEVLRRLKLDRASLSRLKYRIDQYRDQLANLRRSKIMLELNETGYDTLYFKAEKMLDSMEGRIEYLGLEYKDLYEDYIAVRRTGIKKHGRADIKYCL